VHEIAVSSSRALSLFKLLAHCLAEVCHWRELGEQWATCGESIRVKKRQGIVGGPLLYFLRFQTNPICALKREKERKREKEGN
jgi:hypothetical protein